MHRDLKAENIFLSKNFTAKICDFGLARRVPEDASLLTAETGTYRWMAPEIIAHKSYGTEVDVFSFGVMCWEIVTGGRLPYETLNPLQAAVAVVHQGLRPEIPETCSQILCCLMRECWETLPARRPHFSEIVVRLQEQELPKKTSKKSFLSRFRKEKQTIK